MAPTADPNAPRLVLLMLNFRHGNLLDDDSEALINTVNTVGVMGKGIALQFRQAFPDNYREYSAACKRGEVISGSMFVTRSNSLTGPKFIINFPTKRHWREGARIDDIENGLQSLVECIQALNISSVAIPPLGCGNGGLQWETVKPLMVNALSALSNVQVNIYQPLHAGTNVEMRISTLRPKMTAGRAAVLGMLERYAIPGYRATLLEVQKLAYFLQESGEELRLDYRKRQFGPYAENLNHVLQRIDGHFIDGYGDRVQRGSIRVREEALTDAQAYLESHPDTVGRLKRVYSLMDGFETPYGMELLSTVHWIVRQHPALGEEFSSTVIDQVHSWSQRKRDLMQPHHIEVAWQRLNDQDWFKS